MREILFRGQRKDNGEWVEGGILHCGDGAGEQVYIIVGGISPTFFEVIPETVGEYTGLKDKNGVKIFEGDIVNIWAPEYLPEKIPEKEPVVIKWEQFSCSFMIFDKKSGDLAPISWFNGNLDELRIEVIGNIYDTPEL